MEMTADQSFTMTSVNDGVTISAKTFIQLQVGTNYLRITADMITLNGRILKIQSDAPGFTPAVPGAFVMPRMGHLPITDGFHEQFQLVDEFDQPQPHTPYRIRSRCGKKWQGISDADGLTQRIFTENSTHLEIDLLKDNIYDPN